MWIRRPLVAISLLLAAAQASAIDVDGHVDPTEWTGAKHITEFRQIQPFTGAAGSQTTEAWVLATPEGLAIAFHNVQPASVPRTRQKVQRDFSDQVDRVNVYVDFNGDGRIGYNFRVSSTDGIADLVITNENVFNGDWDGTWQHAVSETPDGWSVEMLLPWYIAPMRSVKDGTRGIGIALDRVIGSSGERSAWPLASFERPRFLSEFSRMEVQAFSQALLAVTPFVSLLRNRQTNLEDRDGGVDCFWKPNGQLQFSGTINPDFGQVETDDLVVNFSASETFVDEKRPFFTENQSLFDFTTPSDSSQLLYTRRIGAPSDDGHDAADITAAAKVNGSFGATSYGVFSAREGNAFGRSFDAIRVVHDAGGQNFGAMLVHADRPYLSRDSYVLGMDHNWRPNARWNVQTRLIESQVTEHRFTTKGSGATVLADYQMDHGWRQQWAAMHFGDGLELNDAGFLSRANFNYLHWEVRKRFDDQARSSRYASKEWRFRASGLGDDHGRQLGTQMGISRQSRLRNGGTESLRLDVTGPGLDDRLSRGHGAVQLPSHFFADVEYYRPKNGRWGHLLEVALHSGGLSGNARIGGSASYQPTFYVNDTLSLSGGLYADRTPDWLVWQEANVIGSYEGYEHHVSLGANWSPGDRHEFRVKLQAIAVAGKLRRAYAIGAGGKTSPEDGRAGDFSVRSFGLQVRYGYELAPLSHLYVVYGRGGYRREEYLDTSAQLLQDAFGLHDDEQLLVKLNYRFEL